MLRKLLLVLGVVLGLIVLGALIVLPAIEEEMMQAPFTRGLMALRNGDMPRLRGYFMPNALFGNARLCIPVDGALERIRTYMENKAFDSDVRFEGFTRMQRESPTRVSADFTITIYYEGDDSPYQRVPIDKKGHVVLEKVGFMTWKIQRLTSDEPEVEALLQGAGS